VLFGSEAWERFSYYGMRALLVLYMVNHLKFERKYALEIYGLYTGLVYLTPIAGGYFADKVLGRRKAVLIGGITMALGHLAMAFRPALFLALGLLIVGNGFFKPNISTIVGGLYKEGDTRRDGGFTIFYMGINLGAYFSPKVCGLLGEKVGWHWGFSAAAIGMSAGLVTFIWGQKFLERVGLPPRKAGKDGELADEGPARLQNKDYVDVLIWVAGACSVVLLVLKGWKLSGLQLSGVNLKWKMGVLLAAFCGACALLFRGSTKEEAQRIAVIVILCLFNIFFWMGFEQAGGTMTLFADAQTQRNIAWVGVSIVAAATIGAGLLVWRTTKNEPGTKGFWLVVTLIFVAAGLFDFGTGFLEVVKKGTFEVPASQFQSVNPLIIVALAPAFSQMWMKLDEGKYKTSTPTKMSMGMIVLGLGFVVMFVGQKLAQTWGKVSPGWLIAVYAIHTVGELCLSPIGLSMVTKLAPQRVVSLAMGLWFMSSALANYLAGTLESILEKSHTPIYAFLIASSIGPAILLLALTPVLKKWMHGRA